MLCFTVNALPAEFKMGWWAGWPGAGVMAGKLGWLGWLGGAWWAGRLAGWLGLKRSELNGKIARSEKNVKIATPCACLKVVDSCFTVFVREQVLKRQRFT